MRSNRLPSLIPFLGQIVKEKINQDGIDIGIGMVLQNLTLD